MHNFYRVVYSWFWEAFVAMRPRYNDIIGVNLLPCQQTNFDSCVLKHAMEILDGMSCNGLFDHHLICIIMNDIWIKIYVQSWMISGQKKITMFLLPNSNDAKYARPTSMSPWKPFLALLDRKTIIWQYWTYQYIKLMMNRYISVTSIQRAADLRQYWQKYSVLDEQLPLYWLPRFRLSAFFTRIETCGCWSQLLQL